MALKPCIEPGCPTLTKTSRCTKHEREKRGSTSQRGYGPAHRRQRAAWQRRMDRGETFTCWRCGDSIDPEHWHLGHSDHDRTTYLGPECIPCNTATRGRT